MGVNPNIGIELSLLCLFLRSFSQFEALFKPLKQSFIAATGMGDLKGDRRDISSSGYSERARMIAFRLYWALELLPRFPLI